MKAPNLKWMRFLPALLVLLAFWALNLPHLGIVPTVNGDEPWQSSTAYKLARDGIFGSDLYAGYHGMEQRYFGFLPLYPMTLAVVFRFAEGGLWQARFVSVACGTLILSLTFALARRLWHDVRLSVLAIFLLLTLRWFAESPLHPTGILFLDATRVARYDVLVPVLALAALHLFLSARQTARPILYLLTGILGGLAGLAHLYGLAVIPVLCALILWQSRSRRGLYCALVLLGAIVTWLPYIAFVLGDIPDWLAQTRVYAPRFDLFNPLWYWENFKTEATRYALGTNQNPPLLLRPGFWIFVLVLPVSVVLLLKRAILDRDARAQFIVTPLILFAASFAALLQLKFTNYLLLLMPFASIVVAWTMLRLWEAGIPPNPFNTMSSLHLPKRPRNWARVAVVLLLAAVYLEATTRISHLNALAATTTPYAEVSARLREVIPHGARVVGLPKYAYEYDAYIYRSVHVALGLSNPMLTRSPVPLAAALDAQQPDYFLVDDDLRVYFNAGEDGNGARFAAWLAAHHATRVASIHDVSYGLLELWHIGD